MSGLYTESAYTCSSLSDVILKNNLRAYKRTPLFCQRHVLERQSCAVRTVHCGFILMLLCDVTLMTLRHVAENLCEVSPRYAASEAEATRREEEARRRVQEERARQVSVSRAE